MEGLVSTALLILGIYLLLGLVFAIFFLTKGMQKMDNATKDSGIGFKLVILPGVIALWIYLLFKWGKLK